MISIFDMFKIGVGPSSSHTNGPMKAANRFIDSLVEKGLLDQVGRVVVGLYGSLSLTGRGHHSDKAAVKGLMGFKPETIDIKLANQCFTEADENGHFMLNGTKLVDYDYDRDVIFNDDNLPLHENGLMFTAMSEDGAVILTEKYYSIGGGFVANEEEMVNCDTSEPVDVEFPFRNARELLQQAEDSGLSIARLALRNELAFNTQEEMEKKANAIWDVMTRAMKRGFVTEGILEGGLGLTRRAPSLLKKVDANAKCCNDPMVILDWITIYALAVSEENAAGGQVVTSPTNGAAGVVPAVLTYYHKFVKDMDTKQVLDFLAVSAAIGMLYKRNASISGAEVGCQGEIGVSTSMAAAGLCSLKGGSNEQICIAAEIGMEHSLGMTCDPVGGLVQIPCIERNAMGAVKAVTATRMALQKCTKSLISLDTVIQTMYMTGKDMNSKYRETARGGLAVCTSHSMRNKVVDRCLTDSGSTTAKSTAASIGGCCESVFEV